MDLKKQFWVVMLIASLILVFVFSQENGFTFILSHTYEIGSVRKPRQMQWTTTNWRLIVPLLLAILSVIGFISNRKGK
jgi:succinate dehydrogenase/fumarate reductase cytochrome b subunit